MSDDLVGFLRARLVDEEKRARDPEALAVWLAEKLLMARGLGTTTSMPLSEAREEWLPAARSITEWMLSPEGQMVLAAVGQRRDAEQSCHCFCSVGHPGSCPCEGVVLESEVIRLQVGGRDVPVCPPCAEGWRTSGDVRTLAAIDRAVRGWETRPDAMRWRP